MSSILSSQAVVFATAMAAVSGTVILLAFRLQKSLPATQFALQVNSLFHPHRSCISLDGKKKGKKKKKVHFAEDVVDPIGNSDEYRKLRCKYNAINYHQNNNNSSLSSSSSESSSSDESNKKLKNGGGKLQKHHHMPANRVALYNGILRDRVLHRVAYSY